MIGKVFGHQSDHDEGSKQKSTFLKSVFTNTHKQYVVESTHIIFKKQVPFTKGQTNKPVASLFSPQLGFGVSNDYKNVIKCEYYILSWPVCIRGLNVWIAIESLRLFAHTSQATL